MTRRMVGGLTAIALLLVLAVPVMAGGWATIQADSGTPPTPNQGQEVTFGFTVLQHGVTPAGWVTPSVVLTNTVTGDTIEAKATGEGADGHFTATLTAPASGYWTWHVAMPDLLVETGPAPMTILTAAGEMPAIDPAMVTKAVDQALVQFRAETQESISAGIGGVQADVGALRGDVVRLNGERDELATRLEALESGATGGVPAIAVITLAILGGALAGFAMAWLGRRSDVTERSAPSATAEEGVAPGGVLTTR